MLSRSDIDVAVTLRRFGEKNIDVALLVPTRNGLEKSIMDATAPVRELLAGDGLHDYDKQGQGESNKVVLDVFLLGPKEVTELRASLYRPTTKSGDPRIWFSNLGKVARPDNLLALFVYQGQLYLVNCSNPAALDALDDPASPLGEIAAAKATAVSPEASELLGMLKVIAGKGFCPTIREGDTGVGTTLEHLLGIPANTRRTPDYKGIEIKAARRKASPNRVTLFSQVPDWKKSPIGNVMNLLNAIGYRVDDRLQYYHTMSAVKANSHGLMLEIDGHTHWLNQVRKVGAKIEPMTTWDFELLKGRLREKHAQTFWVKANARKVNGREEYHYTEVIHTRAPFANRFEMLVDSGNITLDYTLSQVSPTRVNDHGYLFKIKPEDIGALFPPAMVYRLC